MWLAGSSKLNPQKVFKAEIKRGTLGERKRWLSELRAYFRGASNRKAGRSQYNQQIWFDLRLKIKISNDPTHFSSQLSLTEDCLVSFPSTEGELLGKRITKQCYLTRVPSRVGVDPAGHAVSNIIHIWSGRSLAIIEITCVNRAGVVAASSLVAWVSKCKQILEEESYLVNVAVLVDALHKAITKSRPLGAINDHLSNTTLLRRNAGWVAYKGDATIGLHKAWVVWLRGIWVLTSADIDASTRLIKNQRKYQRCLITIKLGYGNLPLG